MEGRERTYCGCQERKNVALRNNNTCTRASVWGARRMMTCDKKERGEWRLDVGRRFNEDVQRQGKEEWQRNEGKKECGRVW